MFGRRVSRKVKAGHVEIGGKAPISIQSMTNTDTRDFETTSRQILALQDAGCEIIRIAIPDMEAAENIKKLKTAVKVPLVADIHFDYTLALKSIEMGIDKIRINPGNIGSFENVRKVADAAKEKGIPIRIGINSGSIEKRLLEKYGGATPEAMVESALTHGDILLKAGFYDIVYSLKASNVPMTVAAYRYIADKTDAPLHIGITEAGTEFQSTVKSSAGLGILLSEGIGDTMRVSVTGDPLVEVKIAKSILRSLDLRKDGIEIISCPTCGRTCTDIIPIVKEIEDRIQGYNQNMKIAIMGCAVNGPGEAKEADAGVACGKNEGLIFRKGEVIRKVREEEIVENLMREINDFDKHR